MKAFIRLLRFELRTTGYFHNLWFSFKHDPAKARKNLIILIVLAFCLLPAYSMYITMSAAIARLGAESGLLPTLLAYVFTAYCIFGTLMGSLTMLTRVFLAKDGQFFAALPVKQQTVFAAKIGRLYVSQLVVALFILLPAIIACGICSSFINTFYGIIAIIIVPFIPLLISALLSSLLMPIASRVKNRDNFITALSLVLSLLIVAGNMLLNNLLPQDLEPEYILSLIKNGSLPEMLRSFFPPSVWLGLLAAGVDVPKNLALSMLCVLAAGVITLLIASRMYYKGALAANEASVSVRRKKADYTLRPVSMTYFIKEWRCILKTPVYAMNCLCGTVIVPVILAVSFVLKAGTIDTLRAMLSSADVFMLALIFAAILSFVGGVNPGGSTMISREGKSFYILKLIPVSLTQVISGKLYASLSVSIAGILLTGVVMLIATQNTAVLLALPIALLVSYIVCCLCMLFDCFHPNLDWANETVIIKQSLNGAMSLIAVFGLIIACAITALPLTVLITPSFAYIALIAILCIVAVFLHGFTAKKCAALLNKHGK